MKRRAFFPSLQLTLPLVLLTGTFNRLPAQDLPLPPTNLGLANVFDGIAGKPGFVYQGYAQLFQTRGIYNQHGISGNGCWAMGLAYFFTSGGLLEVKAFSETAAQNRPAGFRPTLRIAIPFQKS